MSNMPDINSKRITVTLHLQLYAKLLAYAKAHSLSQNDAARLVFAKQLEKVNLTADDYKWMAEQVEINTSKRKEV